MSIRKYLFAGAAVLAIQLAVPARMTVLAPAQAETMMTGGDLRVAVNTLLAAHVNLAAAATGWAMMGMTGNFKSAASW